MTERSRWLSEAITTWQVSEVPPNMAAAGERITDARQHVVSAQSLADSDPTLGMTACHDAIRKAITAHMEAAGLKPKDGDGAHRIVLEYAEHELVGDIEAEDLIEARRIRQDRGIAEYGQFARRQISAEQVRESAIVAECIVRAVAQKLAGQVR